MDYTEKGVIGVTNSSYYSPGLYNCQENVDLQPGDLFDNGVLKGTVVERVECNPNFPPYYTVRVDEGYWIW